MTGKRSAGGNDVLYHTCAYQASQAFGQLVPSQGGNEDSSTPCKILDQKYAVQSMFLIMPRHHYHYPMTSN